ncbi:Aspartyl-tRNA(Asn) amidotransferase subunit A Glutamyl-tRNA(Gln) amidotransferase subunit A [Caballeronia sordidicola]|uniref:Aspartyl-tRNA(Asn) amidotransferase subunit A Glutamyl-tRNA(Gln) amidotransferase subunit A n=1 Tax=Caballeronia sordidicola TaxID=196367 RepID=A0A242MYL3_CABSO|nr:Aspartyl-tRNA(Asn) amidotransferase subunit A Glutamyl-tRNA(Gln) amidotransferase subunit A [Caballeronia sordidicola]
MKLSEYASYDAVGLGGLVSRREVSSYELARTALRACEAANPHINAVIETWQPEPADVAPKLGNGSPLAGVPFLIKDVGVTMAGRKLEFGSRLAEGFTAVADSILMQRFRRAGLVTLGRTTTPSLRGAVRRNPRSSVRRATHGIRRMAQAAPAAALLRRCCGRRRRHRAARSRYRCSRLDSHSIGHFWRIWPQADPWPRIERAFARRGN